MKYCTDCKHYWRGSVKFAMPPRCHNPDTREPTGRHLSLELLRHEYGVCGPSGKFFEQKPIRLSLWQRLTGSATTVTKETS